jgi:CheY-like chemotaxis protein
VPAAVDVRHPFIQKPDALIDRSAEQDLSLTAFARKEDRKRATAVGFDSHLAKPVDPQQLVYEIGALITARR